MVNAYIRAVQRSQERVDALPFHEWKFPDGGLWMQFFRKPLGYLLRFPSVADFEISADGKEVVGFPAPDADDDAAEHLYLNQVLPLALSRQGHLVFHASAVDIGGDAVAFLGESGRGKSTLAGSFSRNGFRVLTDDGLVLVPCEHGYRVMPSEPSIRLWPDSERALVGENLALAVRMQLSSKARFRAGDGFVFCDRPRPLRRIYFLGDRESGGIAFERLTAAEALVQLVKNSFLLDVEEANTLALHFDQVSGLSREVVCYRLAYLRQYGELSHVRTAIIEHAGVRMDVECELQCNRAA